MKKIEQDAKIHFDADETFTNNSNGINLKIQAVHQIGKMSIYALLLINLFIYA